MRNNNFIFWILVGFVVAFATVLNTCSFRLEFVDGGRITINIGRDTFDVNSKAPKTSGGSEMDRGHLRDQSSDEGHSLQLDNEREEGENFTDSPKVWINIHNRKVVT